MSAPYPALFSPLALGTLLLKNRVVMAPMSTSLGGITGEVTPANIAFYRERALGGFGLIIVEFTCVDPTTGRTEERQLSLDSPRNLPGHARLVDTLHRSGAKAFVQLQHGGRFAPAHLIAPKVPKGPSIVASRKDASKILAQAFEDDEIERLVAAFGRTAALAATAGYDGIEIHGAHGYLLSQFLSPLSNQRDDRWGGDAERRMAFPLAVARRVKAESGGLPLSFRLSADEFLPGGLTIEDSEVFARRLASCGVDIIHVSTGRGPESFDKVMEPISAPEGWRLPYARRIRDAAGIPVIGVGQIRWPETAEDAVARGDADLIALGRPSLADPEWPNKAASGRREAIRPCTSCNWCISGALSRVGCAENPRAGAELDAEIPAMLGQGRRAVVIGAGPGGMTAALLLDQAGFETHLYEARPATGGGLVASATPPGKDKLFWYRDYLDRRLRDSRVTLHLGQQAGTDELLAMAPALAVVATGTTPRRHDIELGDGAALLDAFAVLMGDLDPALPPGSRVVVYGGGETGCETAEYFAEQGHRVVLVTRSAARDLARSAEMVYRIGLTRRLRGNPAVEILELSTLVAIRDGTAIVTGPDQTSRRLPAEGFFLAQGREPQAALAETLVAAGIACHVIGDSSSVGRIGDAVQAAYQMMRSLVAQTAQAQRLAC